MSDEIEIIPSRTKITLPDGREGWVYASDPEGTIRNDRGGYLVKPPTAKPITKENAGDLARRRALKAKLVAGKAIQDASGGITVYDGWGAIIRKRAEVALTDMGKAGNDAAKFVGQAAGLLDAGRDHEEKVIRHEYSIAPEAMQILEEIRRRQNG